MSEEAQHVEQVEVEKKPRRTTARKPKAEAAEPAMQAEAATPAKPVAKAKPAAKPAATKRAAVKAAEAKSDAQPAPETKAQDEEAPKPRRGRKPKVAQEEQPAQAESAPKPRTRSTRAAKPKEEPVRALTEAEAAALIAAGPVAAARQSAEAASKTEAPAKAAAPKRKPASKNDASENAEATEKVESAPSNPAPQTAEVDPTAPYPKRRRVARTQEAADGSVATDSAETPRRRPRRSVKAEGGAVAFAAEDAAQAVVNPAPEGKTEQEKTSADVRPGRSVRGERKTSRSASDEQQSSSQASVQGDSQSEGQGAASGNGKNKAGAKRQGNRNSDRGNGNRNDRNNGNRSDHNARNHNGRNKRDRNREIEPSVTREGLAELKVADLRAKAAELELDVTGLKKAELVEAVYDATVKAEGFLEVSGILDILADGYGFVRTQGYLPSENDCYVGLSLVKRNGLRKGDLVVAQTRPVRPNEKYRAIHKIISVNGTPVEELGRRVRFADLTPVYPQERLRMEHGKNTITSRVIDLVAPIGKGQRGLIVSPPKAGKTTILKDIAASISANNPEVHLMCLLIDERPEEVTDMERSIKGEVVSSTFDMPADNHIACAEMVIERAKRLVENGQDVVILLDSITRVARAYNLAQPASGRVLSGGVDSTALYPPKKFLGAARNIENGGSLTILASALIDTGSKMDEVIFEEFKGTGNMELKLDRSLADRRIFPAIDAVASGTRKEELLMDAQVAPLIWAVRRILANMNNTERATDTLIKSIKQTENNEEFLLRMARKAHQGTKVDSLEL